MKPERKHIIVGHYAEISLSIVLIFLSLFASVSRFHHHDADGRLCICGIEHVVHAHGTDSVSCGHCSHHTGGASGCSTSCICDLTVCDLIRVQAKCILQSSHCSHPDSMMSACGLCSFRISERYDYYELIELPHICIRLVKPVQQAGVLRAPPVYSFV